MEFCAVSSFTKLSRNSDLCNKQNIQWCGRIRQLLGVGFVPLFWRHLLSVEQGHGICCISMLQQTCDCHW